MWHYQIKNIYNPSMIFEPYLIFRARFCFGQHQEHGFKSDPKQEVCESWSNRGCQGFQKETFIATAHKLEMARVRVLSADQKKVGSGDVIAFGHEFSFPVVFFPVYAANHFFPV